MRLCHLLKLVATFGGQTNQEGASVALDVHPLDKAFCHQLISDAGHVAASDHHAARQLFHLHALGHPFQLRHQVKAGECGFKLFA